MGCVSPPLSLIQNRTGDFDVPFARLRRSALQPLPQCTATVLAVHCIHHRSALHLFPQTFASAIANVCIPGCKRYHPSLQTLSLKRRLHLRISSHVFLLSQPPSKVCAPEAQRPGEGRTTPYIYILWYREVQQKLPGGPSSKRGIQKAETEISNCSAI